MLAESLVALASAGGTALVGAMATDAWQTVRDGAARLFGRGGAAGQELVEARLDRDAGLVALASEPERARQGLAPAWQVELEALLTAHPELADELRVFVEQTVAALPRAEQHWTLNVTARDHGRAYGALGGNVVVHEAAQPDPPRGPVPDGGGEAGEGQR
ncbi:hypothetical protein OU787_05560 [Kitasatospora sp. YST-16]|uniref:hypothetical protein n=1 Tax=Kitasatospora sp. YST-16 TaxID=2998080 RepID=UPI002284379B|nr:hypothetical protein [Kitasatospora sp. YST-16]WAL71010.1 hypothetical protein OU787_05560 [Kitasatospora sp. YST-16]WNW37048.1 hypothetical protein RKE32_05530 [Streptomyces sp. Li-HN-5-13]